MASANVGSAATAPVPAAASASSSGGGGSENKKRTVLKVILLGASGAGKTSLLNRFVDNAFNQQYKATLGADMREKEVVINDERYVLQIWDTAGQERFNSLTKMFVTGANMCMLVFDLTRADSFEALTLWRDQFLSSTRHDKFAFPFACVANKCDVAAQRAVSQRRANTWCSTNGDIPYFEVSAKEGVNVHQAFMDLARKAVKQLQLEKAAESAAFAQTPSVVLTPSVAQPPKQNAKKSGGCCNQ